MMDELNLDDMTEYQKGYLDGFVDGYEEGYADGKVEEVEYDNETTE